MAVTIMQIVTASIAAVAGIYLILLFVADRRQNVVHSQWHWIGAGALLALAAGIIPLGIFIGDSLADTVGRIVVLTLAAAFTFSVRDHSPSGRRAKNGNK